MRKKILITGTILIIIKTLSITATLLNTTNNIKPNKQQQYNTRNTRKTPNKQ